MSFDVAKEKKGHVSSRQGNRVSAQQVKLHARKKGCSGCRITFVGPKTHHATRHRKQRHFLFQKFLSHKIEIDGIFCTISFQIVTNWRLFFDKNPKQLEHLPFSRSPKRSFVVVSCQSMFETNWWWFSSKDQWISGNLEDTVRHWKQLWGRCSFLQMFFF